MEVSLVTVTSSWGRALRAPRTLKRWRPAGARTKIRARTTESPGRALTRSARRRQRRRRAGPHGLGLSAAPTPPPGTALAAQGWLWREAYRRADNGEGVFFQILPPLRLTALASREGFNLILRFFARRWGMRAKGCF